MRPATPLSCVGFNSGMDDRKKFGFYLLVCRTSMAGDTFSRSNGHETSQFLFTKCAMTAQRKDGPTLPYEMPW